MKNIYDMLIWLTLVPRMILEPSGCPCLGRFKGSSHVQGTVFLTFNYSLGPVRNTLVCPLLYLSCARTRDQTLLITHLMYHRVSQQSFLSADVCLSDLSFTWCQSFVLKKKKKRKEERKERRVVFCILIFPSSDILFIRIIIKNKK